MGRWSAVGLAVRLGASRRARTGDPAAQRRGRRRRQAVELHESARASTSDEAAGWSVPQEPAVPSIWNVHWDELPAPGEAVAWLNRVRTYGCYPRKAGRKFCCCSVTCAIAVWAVVGLSFIGLAAMPLSFFPSSSECVRFQPLPCSYPSIQLPLV